MRALIETLGLGFMGAVAPCVMAANIAALAYISRRLTDPKYTFFAGLLYTLGRLVSYSVIGIAIIAIGHRIEGLSAFFEKGYYVLGPFFIAGGLLMLFIDKIPFLHGGSWLATLGEKVSSVKFIGPFLLGVILALAFCPVSALLFFVMLMPIAIQASGGFMLPAVFAIATGLPVIAFGTLVSLGISRVSSWVNAIMRSERYVRMATSLIFIGIGIYYLYLWLR